jgi:N-acetylmuramic acid 6-phosphate etherase
MRRKSHCKTFVSHILPVDGRAPKGDDAAPSLRPAEKDSAAMTESASPLPPARHAERLTEQRNPATRTIDRLPVDEALKLLHAEDRKCFEAVEACAPEVVRAVELVTRAFYNGGRLIYLGAGTSGRLGVLDASEQPPTFGADPDQVQGIIAGGAEALVRSIEGAEDDPADGEAALRERGLAPDDVVMGIATGGRTPFVLGGLRYARSIGAATILLTCTPPLEGEHDLADCQIRALTGPEAVTGSTRMKAGTATKLILNQITTLAMIQFGKVYENLMVDLQLKNSKLRDRARRILMELGGIDETTARRQLKDSGGDLKTAIVMTLAGCGAEQARRALELERGHVARTIAGIRAVDPTER